MSASPAPLDPISREYLTLALAIDRLAPGFVDAYLGPPELKAAADDGDAPDPKRLQHRVRGLLIRLSEADLAPSRIGYLSAQLEAMLTICRTLAGEMIPYQDEVRHLFDVVAERTPDSKLDAAINQLESVLPGDSPLAERMIAWRKQFEISPETALALIDVIQPEIRQRTLGFVDLPPGEGIEYRLVQNQPWSGYNWYLGNGRSRVEFNTDLPMEASRLTDLLCHEGYPGHHTEHTLKELLYLEHGYGEHAIQLINTPECIISEGVASLAEEVLLGADGIVPFRHEFVYPAAGITVDPDQEAAIRAAAAALKAVPANAALLLHADGRSEDEVLAYLMRYGLVTEQSARKRLEFISNPLWRAYIFTYHAGYDLLGAWLDAGMPNERLDRFRTLLTEQVYPSLIMKWLAEAYN